MLEETQTQFIESPVLIAPETVTALLFGEWVAAQVVDRDEDGRVYVQTFPGSETFCMKPEQIAETS